MFAFSQLFIGYLECRKRLTEHFHNHMLLNSTPLTVWKISNHFSLFYNYKYQLLSLFGKMKQYNMKKIKKKTTKKTTKIL
jgi:hypothetical protein